MKTYVDINKNFTDRNNMDKATVADLEDIKQSLLRLFSTPKGSVPFNRNYGTTLRSLLFENDIDASDVAMFLYMDITDFEPRVQLSPYNISITQVDRNTYSIECTFTVPSINAKAESVKIELQNK